MTLTEQLTEFTEIKDLLKQALKDNLSSGALVGYTTNGTKIVYTNIIDINKQLREYSQLIATTEHQIASLRFRGISV